jgi:transposase
MKPDQYKALHKLAKLKEGSKASKGAHLVLVHGKSQVKAASMIGCSQSTISAAVSKLKEAQRLANHAAIRH